MKFIKTLCLIATGVFLGIAHGQEAAKIYIDIGAPKVKKSLLALTPIKYVGTQGTNASHLDAGQKLYQVIYNDLAVSNYFTMIKPDAYLEDPSSVGIRPAPGHPGGFNFKNWSTIGAEFLVRGAYQVLGLQYELEIYVYHVPTGKMVMGKNYKSPVSAYRKLAHTFSNDLLQALTGKKGMFLSKIVASRQDLQGKAGGIKEIYVMDWDGADQKQVSFHNSLAISPAWSTKGDMIAYTAFAYHKKNKVRNADLFTYNLETGKRLLVSYRKGINSGAAFMPGDNFLLLTISQGGSPDIFRMNVNGTGLLPLTRGPNKAMNVEPAVSADGSNIAFSSDRGGRPMVYVMNADGSGVRMLTRTGKYNSSPAWSPDGKTIAFAGFDSDHFDIFTIGVDGKNLKRLTDAKRPDGKGSNNESPSWSPDGRHISFVSNRTGRYQIYLLDPDGTNERQITNDQKNWDKPKWSPFLE